MPTLQKIFSPIPGDSNSLPSSFNTRVFKGKSGIVWVGTEAGLAYFNPSTHSFKAVDFVPKGMDPKQLKAVSAIVEDAKGKLWIGSYLGLVFYDPIQHHSELYRWNTTSRRGANAVTDVFIDHQGNIWASVWGKGLCIVDQKEKRLRSFIWNSDKSFPGTVNVSFGLSESEDAPGQYSFWLGTTEGLKCLNFPDRDSQNYNGWYRQLAQIVLSTPFLKRTTQNIYGFRGRQVSSIYRDSSGIIWVSTDEGVNSFLPNNQKFESISIEKGMVNSILKTTAFEKKVYLVGTWYGQGLIILDTNLKIVRRFKEIPPDSQLLNNRQVSDILPAGGDEFWVGTFNGLFQFNIATKAVTAFVHIAGNSQSPVSNHITALAKDDSGHIWMGTYDKGVSIYNPKTGQYRTLLNYDAPEARPVHAPVWRIQNLTNGLLALCTDNGLSLYHEKTGKIDHFEDEEKEGGFHGDLVSGVVCEGDSILWIGTNKGLNRFDFRTRKFRLFTHEDGLKDDNILALTSDAMHRIWLVTRGAIISINSRNFRIINYDEHSGLPQHQLVGPIVSDFNQNFLVGCNDYVLKFSPSNFLESQSNTEVYFRQLWISGTLYKTTQALSQFKRIVLDYPKNNFSCSFDAPLFFKSSPVHYRYRLVGLNNEWVAAGTRNFVSFSNLTAGHYIFEVNAQEQDGSWSNSVSRLHLEVLPPFWQTWWFRVAVILTVGLLGYLLFSLRIRNVKKAEALKAKLSTQMSDLRLKAMRSRMNPHFMFNALNSIQECIYTGNTKSAYKYLSKFSKLVRLILERSDQMFVSVQQEVEMLKLYLALESLRFQDSFMYNIVYEPSTAELLNIPPMLIQPFVENALWHGLANKGGSKILKIEIQVEGQFIKVSVYDNGIGRAAAKNFRRSTSFKQHSLGLKLVAEQLEVVTKLSGMPAKMNTIDLLDDESGLACGTIVEVFIPIF